MTTSGLVAAYEQEARLIPGLPTTIVYLPDNPQVVSGLRAFVENGVGFIEGAPNYTVTKRIALHEFGHLWHMTHRDRQDAFWTARFGTCPTAPKTWAEAYTDAHPSGTEIWMVLPGETIAECFAVAIEGAGKERTLDYGCTTDPAAMRTFFGYVMTAPGTIDVRSQLPFVGNIFGLFTPKDSLTFHWNGPAIPPDADPMIVLRGDANHHINQGWGGISYHAAIWTDGTLYITRDADAVLAACGNSIGNARSKHVQVMIGVGQSPSAAQWQRMTELAMAETSVHPHGPFWSATECPGDQIRTWIAEGVVDMTPEQDTRLRNVEAQLAALINQQSALATNIPNTWLRRLFYGINPLTGKRRGVNEVVPPELVVPD